MHKKYSRVQIERVLKDLLNQAGLHMNSLAKEMQEIKLTSESSELDKYKMNSLFACRTILNDVIHPAHKMGLELIPENKEFIEQCIKFQQEAVDKKLITPAKYCRCYECVLVKEE